MKQSLLTICLITLLSAATHAQLGPQRMTLEERVQNVLSKFAEFNLDKTKSKQVDSIFTSFYKAQDKMREELMRDGQRPDPEVLREKNQPLITERDVKLKAVFTEEQFKKWKDEIEPSLRPQRRN